MAASASDFRARYGPWALVAGASEGLGAEFAIQLAARGLHLVLVARRLDRLEALADELRRRHGVEVRCVALDLSERDLVGPLRAATDGLEVGLVVYNAALSLIGPFLERDLDQSLRVVDLNCRGPLSLSHLYGQPMAARGRGGILLMSSLAGTQGTPLLAAYSASKAFNLVFAEALWDELRGSGVDVLACRAGATRTPNFEATQPAGSKAPVMESGAVVREALASLGRTPSMVPGLQNRLAAFALQRVLPRAFAVATMGRTLRKMYRAALPPPRR